MDLLKDDRLQIRVSPAAKRLLEEAASAAHQSVSAFVLQAATYQAEALMAERLVISLSPGAAEVLAEALQAPAQVNDRLAEALGRTRKFTWLD